MLTFLHAPKVIGVRMQRAALFVTRFFTPAIIIALCWVTDAIAADDAVVTYIAADDTKNVYWEINLGGTVWLSIRSPEGVGCAELYWRTYPLFLKSSLGEVCGNVRLDIPGLGKAAVGASLYARATKSQIKIIGSSLERVARDFPAVTFP